MEPPDHLRSQAAQGLRLRQGLENLSARELDILRLTSGGATNGEIAERLAVSVHAVKFHLASIYRKLEVANRTEAAVAFVSASSAQLVVANDAKQGSA